MLTSPASRTGLPTPFAILGCALTSIGCGLLSTLSTTSSTGYWVGYQILSGISRGLTMQQPISAIAAILPKSKLAVGNSFLMFCNVLGGAMFVSFGETVFSNQLRGALEKFAPDVDAAAVLAVGATAFKSVVKPEQVGEVVRAYNQALTRAFVSVAFCLRDCAGWLTCDLVSWRGCFCCVVCDSLGDGLDESEDEEGGREG